MNDFNRIAYVVKNFESFKSLNLFAYGLFLLGQGLISLDVPWVRDYAILIVLIGFAIYLFLLIISPRFYDTSFGTITHYPTKSNFKTGLIFLVVFGIGLCIILSFIFIDLLSIFLGIFYFYLLVFNPDVKTNLVYRKYRVALGIIAIMINFIPFEVFLPFRYSSGVVSFKIGLIALLTVGAAFIFDNFQVLKLMRPIQAESIKNSPASADPVLGDPANLTILAVLANCQNADFIFLRKISHLEETEFYRRIYGLANGGLVYAFQQPNGIYKDRLVASITPLGWEIVTQIYNDIIPAQALPLPGANPI
ncbi:MAG: hypothetical protein BGO39_11725 [Chloroflexi bacterium 54-19]|nr:MAG: hypothetical protein BGO39_11725 [Chloroflexi bacterium 54-19]